MTQICPSARLGQQIAEPLELLWGEPPNVEVQLSESWHDVHSVYELRWEPVLYIMAPRMIGRDAPAKGIRGWL
jgi:hypothetical protein